MNRTVEEIKSALGTLPVLAVIYSNCTAPHPGKVVVHFISPYCMKKFPPRHGEADMGHAMEEFQGYEELAASIHACAETGEEKEVLFGDSPTSGWFVGTLVKLDEDHVILTFKDVRGIVLDNISLGRAAKLANDQNEKFVRALAHDLKEPVRAVAGFTEILLSHGDKLDEAKRADYLERANTGALRLHDMIQELRTYALTDKLQSDVEPMSVHQMIREVIEGMETRIEAEQAKIEVNMALDQEVYVISSLKRIFHNFIDNALKYRGDANPHLIVSVFVEDSRDLVLCVQDNGMGFEPEEAGRIFEPFHRLQPHNHMPGAGMGLAICKDIVTKLGGRIWGVSAGSGMGAKFCFRVPTR